MGERIGEVPTQLFMFKGGISKSIGARRFLYVENRKIFARKQLVVI